MSQAYVEQAAGRTRALQHHVPVLADLALGAPTGAEDALATSVFELALASVVEAIDSGALRPAEPLTVALTMWSATHGVAEMLLMGFPFDDETRRSLVDSVIDTVLDRPRRALTERQVTSTRRRVSRASGPGEGQASIDARTLGSTTPAEPLGSHHGGHRDRRVELGATAAPCRTNSAA